MNNTAKTAGVLWTLAIVFAVLCLAFAKGPWTKPQVQPIPLVDPQLIQPSTFRTSYVQLVRAKADLSDFDCYACHEKGKAPTIRYDTNNNIVVPQEHADVVLAHGSHNRNNNCFNCHNETNLVVLQTRDGRTPSFEESPLLCGSCHGPTYRDWEGGAHGRTGGYWKRDAGDAQRQICVDCHNPHSPKIPSRKPLPGPHPLRPNPDHASLKSAPPERARFTVSLLDPLKFETCCQQVKFRCDCKNTDEAARS